MCVSATYNAFSQLYNFFPHSALRNNGTEVQLHLNVSTIHIRDTLLLQRNGSNVQQNPYLLHPEQVAEYMKTN